MQLVFEFGSPKAFPVVDAIRRTIGAQFYTINCRLKGSDTYEPANESLESVLAKLEDGNISAFILRPSQQGAIRYALVSSPYLDGEKSSFYLGTIEYLEKNYPPIWDLILETPGLTAAALGYDEGVEFGDANLSEETFPWNQWPLVIGALRHPSGTGAWITREGPEIRWFKGSL